MSLSRKKSVPEVNIRVYRLNLEKALLNCSKSKLICSKIGKSISQTATCSEIGVAIPEQILTVLKSLAYAYKASFFTCNFALRWGFCFSVGILLFGMRFFAFLPVLLVFLRKYNEFVNITTAE